jgi:hypothetical protein
MLIVIIKARACVCVCGVDRPSCLCVVCWVCVCKNKVRKYLGKQHQHRPMIIFFRTISPSMRRMDGEVELRT